MMFHSRMMSRISLKAHNLLTPPRSRSSSPLPTHSQLVFVRLLKHEADARLKFLVALSKLVAKILHLGAKVGEFATEAENHRASKHHVNECEKKQGYHSTVPPPPQAGIQALPSERRSCILCSPVAGLRRPRWTWEL